MQIRKIQLCLEVVCNTVIGGEYFVGVFGKIRLDSPEVAFLRVDEFAVEFVCAVDRECLLYDQEQVKTGGLELHLELGPDLVEAGCVAGDDGTQALVFTDFVQHVVLGLFSELKVLLVAVRDATTIAVVNVVHVEAFAS